MNRTFLGFLAILLLSGILSAQAYGVQMNGADIGTLVTTPDTATFVDNNNNQTFEGNLTSRPGENPAEYTDPTNGVVLRIFSGPAGLEWQVCFPNGLTYGGDLIPLT